MAKISSSNVTLKQVARAANTSLSTAVRALSNNGSIKQETRLRVQRIARQLGYRPDWRGRSMVTGKTGLIGLMIGAQQNPSYGFEIIAALQESLKAAQKDLLVLTTQFQLENEESAVETLLARRVDGAVIMSGSHLSESRYLEKLSDAGVRTVVINRYTDSTCIHKILFDNRRSGFDATERFILSGHSAVGFIGEGDKAKTRSQVEAIWGYREAMKAIGRYDWSLETGRDPGPFAVIDDHLACGAAAAEVLLGRHPQLKAIVAADDYKALGAMRWLQRSGRRVPQDVAIMGRGGWPEGLTSHPTLSTYRTPFAAAARLAAALLSERHDEPPDTHVLSFERVVRESCGTDVLAGRAMTEREPSQRATSGGD